MMASVVAAARKANVPCEVSLETVMACGYGVCLGCAVPRFDGGYVYACSEGACIDGRVIDWKK
jgi:dihydroorotate dehydrogenase electron transfer subunit